MADVTILVCPCGMRLKAAGAVPGRVGKCPACGGLLRVPDNEPTLEKAKSTAPTSTTTPAKANGTSHEDPEPPTPSASEAEENAGAAYGLAPVSAARPSTFVAQRDRPVHAKRPPAASGRGIVRSPKELETRLHQSLLYPLRGDTGIALLVLFPPILWVVTIPLLTIYTVWASGATSAILAAVIWLIPAGLLLLPAGGFVLLYFGRIIVTSAVGEMDLPRWPDWDSGEMIRGLARWVWAILIGGFLGGFPSVAYWLYCGDIDLFDAIILVELASVGAIYAQVALLASILYDDPLGAHPLTVLRAIWRVGWAWVVPALVIASFTLVSGAMLGVVLELRNPLASAIAYWLYWVFLLYGSMVVLRVLGLFYHRHAQVLGWFRGRPRWGG